MSGDEAFWRTYARVYDEVLQIIPYQNLLFEIIERAGIDHTSRVLDACCGAANLLWALDRQHVASTVVGLDYSDAMLARARAKVGRYAGTANLIKTDLTQPVSAWGVTGQFDRVIFNNSLCLLPNPADVLAKTATLAAPGAKLVASTPRPNPNIQELLDQHLQLSEDAGISREKALQDILPRLQPLLKCNEQLLKHYGDEFHVPNEPQLRAWFAGSGWRVVDLDLTYAGQNWLVVAEKVAA